MRFDIRYRTQFTYTDEVVESQNELRACPLADDCQRLLDYRVTVHPSARIFSYLDYWGTRVDSFGVRRPHRTLEVVAESSVETTPRPLPTAAPRMDALEHPEFVDAHVEYLVDDDHTRPGDRAHAEARRQVDLAGPDVVGVVLSVHRFIGAHLRYEVGATHIGITVEEVLANGAGVCQDYAHLAVSMCRILGIPARYVSGYLFTEDDSQGADAAGDVVHVQTHAWFEAAVPGWGWLALDPTNGQLVGERHVKIGHGRSYDDVQPHRGVFLGPAESEVDPAVEIRRVESSDIWRGSAGLLDGPGGRFTPPPSSRATAGRSAGAAPTDPARQQEQQQQ